MKIVIIGPAYPLRGGNALFVAHLYEALSGSHDVTVISFSRLYPGFLFPGVRQVDISGVPLKKHPAMHIIDCLHPLTWWISARRAASMEPDLVVFTWWNPFFGPLIHTIVSSIRKRCRATIVAVAENVVSHEGRWIDLALTKYALGTADAFVVLSTAVERTVRKLYPSRPVFTSSLPVYDCYRIGEEISRKSAQQQLQIEGRRVVLFFGYVRRYKGLMTLIESFPSVREKLPDAHLLIVGEFYDEPAPYYAAIDRLGIRPNVTIIPRYVSNEEVQLYYAAANLVVLPYHEATQSGILSIAFGFSRPVIVTNVGGFAELVEDGRTGYIVPPGDSSALAGRIIEYFEMRKESEFTRAVEQRRKTTDFSAIGRIFEEISRLPRRATRGGFGTADSADGRPL